jgi:hypothetical protein
VAIGGLIRQCFGMGRGGSHGRKNNAPKATKNVLYIIDIITLF